MAANLGTLGKTNIDIQADLKDLKKNLKLAKSVTAKAAKEMQRPFNKLEHQFKKTFMSLKTMATGAAVVGLVAATRAAISYADEIGKVADKIGVTTDELQEFRHAAELAAGVTSKQLDMGLQRFSRRVGEAAKGMGELKGTLEQYNIELTDAEGRTRSISSIMDDYADAIQGADSEQEKLRMAFKAFDSEGAALVNMMKDGSEGLDDMRKQAQDLGLVLDENLIRSAEHAKDKLTILAGVIKINLTRALLRLTPAIFKTATVLESKIPAISDALSTVFGGSYLDRGNLADKINELKTEITDLREITNRMSKDPGIFGQGFEVGSLNFFGLEKYDNRLTLKIAEFERLKKIVESFDQIDRLMESLTPQNMAADSITREIGRLSGEILVMTTNVGEATQMFYKFVDSIGGLEGVTLTPEIEGYLDSLKQTLTEYVETKAALEELNKAQSVYNSLIDQAKTPLDTHRASMAALNMLLAEGKIGTNGYNSAVDQLNVNLEKSKDKTLETSKVVEGIGDVGESAISAMADGFTDLALEGKKADQVLKDIVMSITDIALQMAVSGLLTAGFSAIGFPGFAAAGAAGAGGAGIGTVLKPGSFSVGSSSPSVGMSKLKPGSFSVGSSSPSVGMSNIGGTSGGSGIQLTIQNILTDGDIAKSMSGKAGGAVITNHMVRDSRKNGPMSKTIKLNG